MMRWVPMPDTASAVLTKAPVGKQPMGRGLHERYHASGDRKPYRVQGPLPMASTSDAGV